MPGFGLRADANAYSTVIRLFREKGEVDIAQKLMGEMGLIDLCPDLVTYASIIKGFCELGRVDEACDLLKAMRRHGCVPNVVANSAVVDGFCRFGGVDKALEIIGEMEKEGGNSNPNVITYVSVIQILCENGRAKDAFIALYRIEACGCAPNRVTISTFLKGLCMDGHAEETYKLIDRVVGGGSISYDDCFSSLVLCLINVKKVKDAEAPFQRILGSGTKPNGLACSFMIKELISLNRMVDGFHLYDEFESMGLLSTIDSDIYSILLAGLCQEGHSVEAGKLARSMLEEKIGLKHPYVEKAVERLKKLGEMELVIELVKI